ncbi:MAG: RnfABCDGE type electron transport complex subunit B [Coxiellaceae bacterium]|nr:RnfABCDGE type electron transport complex subunit B [Coxiellaceae bacterium]
MKALKTLDCRAASRLAMTEKIERVLPQTQCGDCDYAGCKPYAEAMLNGETDIDRCAPGGLQTLIDLATLFDKDATPYKAQVEQNYKPAKLAVIREHECIGCTKCIQVCPVDAIIGKSKKMHTVINKDCNGCELCIPACPVDCIDMVALAEPTPTQRQTNHQNNKARFEAREVRLQRIQVERKQKHKQATLNTQGDRQQTISARQAAIKAAMSRVSNKNPA